MKKYLITLTLISLLALLPNNVYAIARVDENGKLITEETKDGEYNILVAPDEDQGENSSSTDVVTPEDKAIEDNDKAVSSDDEVINPADGNIDDQIYATGIQDDAAELLTYKEDDNKDNDSLIIIISSIIGVSLGSVGTYLFMLKRR